MVEVIINAAVAIQAYQKIGFSAVIVCECTADINITAVVCGGCDVLYRCVKTVAGVECRVNAAIAIQANQIIGFGAVIACEQATNVNITAAISGQSYALHIAVKGAALGIKRIVDAGVVIDAHQVVNACAFICDEFTAGINITAAIVSWNNDVNGVVKGAVYCIKSIVNRAVAIDTRKVSS